MEGEQLISCQAFRAAVHPGNEDPAILEHLRSCDACLEHAIAADPDVLFRAIGGREMVPPGGVDNFVGDVMAQIRLRDAEGVATPQLPLSRYLRAAAAVLFVIASTLGLYRYGRPEPVAAPVMQASASIRRPLATKAIVETYQSQQATIVELPTSTASDTRVVMIYDESLPADL